MKAKELHGLAERTRLGAGARSRALAALVGAVCLTLAAPAASEGWQARTYVERQGWSAVIEYVDEFGRVSHSERVGSFEQRSDARKAAETAKRKKQREAASAPAEK